MAKRTPPNVTLRIVVNARRRVIDRIWPSPAERPIRPDDGAARCGLLGERRETGRDDEFKKRGAAMADHTERLPEIARAEIVIGTYPDPKSPDGRGALVIKGPQLYSKIAGAAVRLPCWCRTRYAPGPPGAGPGPVFPAGPGSPPGRQPVPPPLPSLRSRNGRLPRRECGTPIRVALFAGPTCANVRENRSVILREGTHDNSPRSNLP